MTTQKIYKITLTTKEPFRIGGVDDPIRGQENPVSIVGDQIVVPGPSLKGALRSEIERYLIDKYYNKNESKWKIGYEEYQPCIPSNDPSLDEKKLIRENKYRSPSCHYPCKHVGKDKDKKCSICPICYFLGATGLPGFVRIPFLKPDIGTISNELYSARIDRFSQTVAIKTNRQYSLVPENTTFTGDVIVLIDDNIIGYQLGRERRLSQKTLGDIWPKYFEGTVDDLIQEFIVERLISIQLMGGYKSKGCGKVNIAVCEETNPK